MTEFIRYTVGDDFKAGDRMLDGTIADFPVWGINAVYADPIERRDKVHTNAILICTNDEDRRVCLEALNRRLGLDVVGHRRA